ncbi:hypothetical protein BZK24_06920 [Helicobacter pylori]|nr:hypothetical protein BZK24_06920 [Helicobacter pylori]
MLSVPLKNEFCIKNKVKNPIVKDQRALSKAYPKSKENQFFQPLFLRTRHFCLILKMGLLIRSLF